MRWRRLRQRKELIVPEQINNATDVRTKINLLLLPSVDRIGKISFEFDGRGGVARRKIHRARFQFFRIKRIAVPEAQRGDVSAGQINRRTDEVAIGKFDKIAVQVAA